MKALESCLRLLSLCLALVSCQWSDSRLPPLPTEEPLGGDLTMYVAPTTIPKYPLCCAAVETAAQKGKYVTATTQTCCAAYMLAVIAACGPKPNPIPPPVPVAGGGSVSFGGGPSTGGTHATGGTAGQGGASPLTPCAQAEARLVALKCHEATTPAGEPFAVACERAAADGRDWHPTCIAKLKACSDVEAAYRGTKCQ